MQTTTATKINYSWTHHKLKILSYYFDILLCITAVVRTASFFQFMYYYVIYVGSCLVLSCLVLSCLVAVRYSIIITHKEYSVLKFSFLWPENLGIWIYWYRYKYRYKYSIPWFGSIAPNLSSLQLFITLSEGMTRKFAFSFMTRPMIKLAIAVMVFH